MASKNNYKYLQQINEGIIELQADAINELIEEKELLNRQIAEIDLKMQSSRALRLARLIRYLKTKIFSRSGLIYMYKIVKQALFVTYKYGPKALKVRARSYLSRNSKENLTSTTNAQDQYEIWLKNNQFWKNDLVQIVKNCQNFKYQPLISVVIPVYNVEEIWLNKAVESVRKQIYHNWEICLVDDASTSKHIKPLLNKYKKLDDRIKVKFCIENQHISLATNEGIKISKGEYITFLDNDDEISIDALYEVVKILNQNPKLDFIYSDEDKLNMHGNREQPLFKPDWSPETTLSMMYTTHLSVYRKSVIDKIGGLRKGYEGSQDYDLVLRATEVIDPKNIHHIPKILYHWRMIPGSTAVSYSEKNYAHMAAQKSLEDTVKRRKIKGKIVKGLTPTVFRLKRDILNNEKVSIIIPTYNRHDLLKVCINSIEKKTTYKNYEIIVVSNNSNDPETFKYFDKIKDKHKVIEYNKPFNFAAINNFASKRASGEHLLFLNNDMEVISEEWLGAMLEHSQLPEVGTVGALLLYPNNTIQHAGVILGIGGVGGVGGVAGHSHKYFLESDYGYISRIKAIQNISAVTGACLMVKKSVFEEVGGYEERLEVSFNDVDLCLKIMTKGYRNIYTPYAKLYHYESISRGDPNRNPKELKRFQREIMYMRDKWGELLDNDPYYNINLTKEREDFGINIKSPIN